MDAAADPSVDMPSLVAETLGHLFYYFNKIQPFIPTYVFLFAGSLIPIYAGSHASLHRPVSAAKPAKRKDGDLSMEVRVEEETNALAGFERSDVILYPLFAGVTLAGLYWLIVYLEDAAVALITVILNAYMSIFGLMGIFSFLSDSLEVLMSYGFPASYLQEGRVWMVDAQRRLTLPVKMSRDDANPGKRTSPLPSVLSRLPVPDNLSWWIRDLANRPAFIVEVQIHKLVAKVRPTPVRIICAQVALAVVLYYNIVDRAWWLTNLLGFSFTYSAFQIISPTNFQIGTMLLTGLLFYDIYMVFYTPMMITVATKLDIPAKIMIPNPEMEGKNAFSMLGLGDIVIPGMMMALALRFDLYMFYLKKQKLVDSTQKSTIKALEKDSMRETAEKVDSEPAAGTPERDEGVKNLSLGSKEKSRNGPMELQHPQGTKTRERYQKAVYKKATSSWGDRFWLGAYADTVVGGNFPKVYFHASVAGYMLGLTITLVILHIFEHGQPALLYLVPGVLGSIWLTAIARGEARAMWKYTEDQEEGRAGKIDSAAILGKSAPSISTTTEDTVGEHTSVAETEVDHEAKSKADTDETSSKERQLEPEHRGSGPAAADETQETKESAKEDTGGDVIRVEGKTSKDSQLAKEERQVTKERVVFRLVVSVPPPPPHRNKADGRMTREALEHTIVDWADGEPMEKRRRIS